MDDSALARRPASPTLRQVHAFAYAKIPHARLVPRFLAEPPPLPGPDFALFRAMTNAKSKIVVFGRMTRNAIRERQRTFADAVQRMGPRAQNRVIYDHVMRVMTDQPGEIFSNRRLTALGVVPHAWILRACVAVPDKTLAQKAAFVSKMFGTPAFARKSLLRAECPACYEVANEIMPLRAKDLYFTAGDDQVSYKYDPAESERALYNYMLASGVPAPNLVTDLMFDPDVRIKGRRPPEMLAFWAVEVLCDALCAGNVPADFTSVCDIVDFLCRSPAIDDKETYILWVKHSVRTGLANGLAEKLARVDREIFSIAASAMGSDPGSGTGSDSTAQNARDARDAGAEHRRRDDEVTSVYRPA